MKKAVIYFLFLTSLIFGSQGNLIIIDGLSCSGKTTVISNLLPLLDESYTLVALDSFVTKLFLQRDAQKISEDVFQKLLFEERQKMYETVWQKVNSGKNVVFDTILMDFNREKDLKESLEKFKDLQVLEILIYCPLGELSRRMVDRNELAKKENNRAIYRPLFLLFKFNDMFKKHVEGEMVIGKISSREVGTAYQIARNDTKDLSLLHALKARCVTNFSLETEREVNISPKIEYDFFVDTSLNNPKECAIKIKQFIQNSDPKAFEQNLNFFFPGK